MTLCLMDDVCLSLFSFGGNRKVLPMRSSGLYSAMGLLKGLSGS